MSTVRDVAWWMAAAIVCSLGGAVLLREVCGLLAAVWPWAGRVYLQMGVLDVALVVVLLWIAGTLLVIGWAGLRAGLAAIDPEAYRAATYRRQARIISEELERARRGREGGGA